jgi:hypothetical protein
VQSLAHVSGKLRAKEGLKDYQTRNDGAERTKRCPPIIAFHHFPEECCLLPLFASSRESDYEPLHQSSIANAQLLLQHHSSLAAQPAILLPVYASPQGMPSAVTRSGLTRG